jgi:squalene synthase HpnC
MVAKPYNEARASIMSSSETRLREAYAECRKLASQHYENFPTASYLVPRDKRDALAAVYAFARYADDVADEPRVENRLEKLADWRAMLDASYAGKIDHPVFLALSDCSERFQLSRENFENLLCAFESDVVTNRHPDFSSLLTYCKYSANPVGRLVLELFGYHDSHLFELSDYICTALQLTNFWQDVSIDFSRDRVYLPLDDLARFNYTLADLRAECSDQRWQELMAFEVARTYQLFDQGRSLPERVHPRLRTQLRLTWLGGVEILSQIKKASYDIFRQRPSLGKWNFLRLYLRARLAPRSAYVAQHRGVTISS